MLAFSDFSAPIRMTLIVVLPASLIRLATSSIAALLGAQTSIFFEMELLVDLVLLVAIAVGALARDEMNVWISPQIVDVFPVPGGLGEM